MGPDSLIREDIIASLLKPLSLFENDFIKLRALEPSFIFCWLVASLANNMVTLNSLPPPPISSESRIEFLEKLARVCAQVPTASPPSPILSTPDSAKLVVGNWTLSCQTEGEVVIHNSDGTKVSSVWLCVCASLCVHDCVFVTHLCFIV